MRPCKLRILGKTWDVIFGNPRNDGELGECLSEPQIITIKEGLKDEQEASTLLHECIHAIDYQLGLGLTERQVLGLETGIYDLLHDPQFVSYLKKKNA